MTLLDRYIIRQFLGTFIFSMMALCIIFLIVNVMETLDKFIDQNISIQTIASYYLNFLPEIIKLLTPIAMLMAGLFSIGKLSNLNEITAMKSGGMSLYRLMFPLFIVSICITLGHLYFNGWIVPESNAKKLAIERNQLKKQTVSSTLFNVYLRDSDTKNIIMNNYDGILKYGSGIIIEEFTSEMHPRIKKRIDAEHLHWDTISKQWLAINVHERTLSEDSSFKIRFTSHDTLPVQLTTRHDDIVRMQQTPDELNFDEQKAYIAVLERGGKDTRRQMIEYHGQYAFPFANIIVILFAIPFSAIRKKSGLALEIATAMIVSFLYLAFTKIGQNIGYSMDIDPLLVGWFPNMLFFTIAILNIFRMRT
ncbi:MAG: LptF/LptG family permease [Candidatus Kapaibacteriota bacterium]